MSFLSLGSIILDLLGFFYESDRCMGTSFKIFVWGGKEVAEWFVYAEVRWSYVIRLGGYKYIFYDKIECFWFNRKVLWQ